MWVNPVGAQGDQVLFGKFWNAGMTDPDYQYGIELQARNTPAFFLGTERGRATCPMGSALPLGQWSDLP